MKYSIIRTDKADEGIRHTVLYLANHFGNEFALEKLDYIENTIKNVVPSIIPSVD